MEEGGSVSLLVPARGCGPANVALRPAGHRGHLREERGAAGAAAPIAAGGGEQRGGYRADEAMFLVLLTEASLCPWGVPENW